MSQPKFEVPAEVRDMAEKTIEQAEKAFGVFLDAANKSLSSIPLPTEMPKKALSFTEQNMKAAFDHAKKVVQNDRPSRSNANPIRVSQNTIHQCQ